MWSRITTISSSPVVRAMAQKQPSICRRRSPSRTGHVFMWMKEVKFTQKMKPGKSLSKHCDWMVLITQDFVDASSKRFPRPDRVQKLSSGVLVILMTCRIYPKRRNRRIINASMEFEIPITSENCAATCRHITEDALSSCSVADFGFRVPPYPCLSHLAASIAAYVMMISAPARRMARRLSRVTARSSIQPLAAAALIIACSALTAYAAVG
jgi:hypothetical protein